MKTPPQPPTLPNLFSPPHIYSEVFDGTKWSSDFLNDRPKNWLSDPLPTYPNVFAVPPTGELIPQFSGWINKSTLSEEVERDLNCFVVKFSWSSLGDFADKRVIFIYEPTLFTRRGSDITGKPGVILTGLFKTRSAHVLMKYYHILFFVCRFMITWKYTYPNINIISGKC